MEGEEASGEAARDRLSRLKPQQPHVGQLAQGEVPVELALEPPPEVVFESDADRRFVTEAQEELRDVGRISGEAGSVALWIRPEWQPDDQNDAIFVQLGEQGIRMTKNVNFLRFEFLDEQGIERGAGVPLDDWKPGEWRHVTGVWVGGKLQLYVDGKLVSQNQFDSTPNFGEEPKVYVGAKLPSGVAAPGEMASLRILNRVLQPDEIAGLAQSTNQPK